jgi:hypothetical protein
MTEPQAIRLLCQMRQITWRESQLWLNGLPLPGDRQKLVGQVFLLQHRWVTDSVH